MRMGKTGTIGLVVAMAGIGVAALACVSSAQEATDFQTEDLVGVWGAERNFSTSISGTLRIRERQDGLVASIAGRMANVSVDGESVSLELPRGEGSFRGAFSENRTSIEGHWIQAPGIVEIYEFATPVRLRALPSGGWQGEVRPFEETLSIYLRFAKEDDGTVSVILRNPERNAGVFIRLDHAIVESDALNLFNADGEVTLVGTLSEDGAMFTILLEGTGTFDFTRRDRQNAPGMYPSPETTPYQYAPPLSDEDGWSVSHASDVGMRADRIEAFVQDILDTESTSHRTPYIQDLVIARRGKLILEEHFYGYHGDIPHDSRSAGKSITSMAVGAAVAEGAFDVGTPVYPLFPESVANPDPRKAGLTVEHLITMSAGYDCDDNDSDTPGNEDRMQSQSEQPDWIRYTLDLPLVRDPGEAGVYCTGGINLLAGLISQATGEWFPEFFRTRLAEPLGIDHYHMNLDPLQRGYGGGGVRLRPRDFIKFGQTMLDDGRWNGRQVLEESWVRSSLQPHASVNGPDDYGYAWWRTVHEVEGRTFESWSATGNGGQLIIIVPDFEVVVTFNGGNYNNFPTWIAWRDELLPAFLVGAVVDR